MYIRIDSCRLKDVIKRWREDKSKKPECFRPNDSAYPLCRGGYDYCQDCQLYEDAFEGFVGGGWE